MTEQCKEGVACDRMAMALRGRESEDTGESGFYSVMTEDTEYDDEGQERSFFYGISYQSDPDSTQPILIKCCPFCGESLESFNHDPMVYDDDINRWVGRLTDVDPQRARELLTQSEVHSLSLSWMRADLILKDKAKAQDEELSRKDMMILSWLYGAGMTLQNVAVRIKEESEGMWEEAELRNTFDRLYGLGLAHTFYRGIDGTPSSKLTPKGRDWFDAHEDNFTTYGGSFDTQAGGPT